MMIGILIMIGTNMMKILYYAEDKVDDEEVDADDALARGRVE